MSSMSDYLENAILDHIFGNSTYTTPTTLYVALFNGTYDGTDAQVGNLTEVPYSLTSGPPGSSGYARVAVTFGAASSGAISNTADITFGPAAGFVPVWGGSITAIGIYDAQGPDFNNPSNPSGNLLFHANLSSAKSVSSGDSLVIGTGALTISLN